MKQTTLRAKEQRASRRFDKEKELRSFCKQKTKEDSKRAQTLGQEDEQVVRDLLAEEEAQNTESSDFLLLSRPFVHWPTRSQRSMSLCWLRFWGPQRVLPGACLVPLIPRES